MRQINKNDPTPLYLQLCEIIKENIENGTWESDKAIPSETEMQNLYNVSRITVRGAFQQLVNEGILYKVRGKGTFVSQAKIVTKSLAYMGFREQLEKMGFEIKTKLLDIKVINANKEISEKLNIPLGEEVLLIERLRFIKENPISHHYSYLPFKTFASLKDYTKLESDQLCHIIEKEFKIKPTKMKETLESTIANKNESNILLVEVGKPLLVLKDIMYNKNNPFEFSTVVFRGDKVKLEYDFDC